LSIDNFYRSLCKERSILAKINGHSEGALAIEEFHHLCDETLRYAQSDNGEGMLIFWSGT
jgi:hypothetical protein